MAEGLLGCPNEGQGRRGKEGEIYFQNCCPASYWNSKEKGSSSLLCTLILDREKTIQSCLETNSPVTYKLNFTYDANDLEKGSCLHLFCPFCIKIQGLVSMSDEDQYTR